MFSFPYCLAVAVQPGAELYLKYGDTLLAHER